MVRVRRHVGNVDDYVIYLPFSALRGEIMLYKTGNLSCTLDLKILMQSPAFILQTMKRTVNRCEFRLSLRNVHELNESTKQWEHQLLPPLHLYEML